MNSVVLEMSAISALFKGFATGAFTNACNYCPDPIFHLGDCVGRLLWSIWHTTLFPQPNILPCPP